MHCVIIVFKWFSVAGDEPRLPPKVLLVYNPNFPSHVDDMIAFTNFLKDTCHLDPLFDLFHIPNSESKVHLIKQETIFFRIGEHFSMHINLESISCMM